jgi:hypothetical protein
VFECNGCEGVEQPAKWKKLGPSLGAEGHQYTRMGFIYPLSVRMGAATNERMLIEQKNGAVA